MTLVTKHERHKNDLCFCVFLLHTFYAGSQLRQGKFRKVREALEARRFDASALDDFALMKTGGARLPNRINSTHSATRRVVKSAA